MDDILAPMLAAARDRAEIRRHTVGGKVIGRGVCGTLRLRCPGKVRWGVQEAVENQSRRSG
jgi:hypothetical protein